MRRLLIEHTSSISSTYIIYFIYIHHLFTSARQCAHVRSLSLALNHTHSTTRTTMRPHACMWRLEQGCEKGCQYYRPFGNQGHAKIHQTPVLPTHTTNTAPGVTYAKYYCHHKLLLQPPGLPILTANTTTNTRDAPELPTRAAASITTTIAKHTTQNNANTYYY